MAAGESDFDLHQDVAEGLDLIAVGEKMLRSSQHSIFFYPSVTIPKKMALNFAHTQIVTAPIFFPRMYF